MEEIIKQIKFIDKLLVHSNELNVVLQEQKVKLYQKLNELTIKNQKP